MNRRVWILTAVIMATLLLPVVTMAATDDVQSESMPWQIINYIAAAIFNIGIVAGVRARAQAAGKAFLSSGRFAWIAVFILCFLELLVAGRFEALNNASAFVNLLKEASAATMAILGVHSAGKTAGVNEPLIRGLRTVLFGGSMLIVLIVVFGFCTAPVHADSLIPEGVNIVPIQLHSLTTGDSCQAGMVPITFHTRPIGSSGCQLAFSANFMTRQSASGQTVGVGIGAALTNGVLRLGIDIGYMLDAYRWTIDASLLRIPISL